MRTVSPTRAVLAALAIVVLVGAGSGCSGSSDAADGAGGSEDAATTTSTTIPAPEGSDGCGAEPDVEPVGDDRPGDVEQSIESGGLERIYRLAIPADYDPDVPAPLILNLHGSGSNALQASVYGDVPREAAKRGMITVAPEAIGGKWELAGTGSDADFLDALVDDIEARYCIDPDRVHAIGMSLGAWKSASTACASGDRYASIALVTVEVFPGACEPMPVIAFHGTADPVVPYGRGGDEVGDVDGLNGRLPPTLDNIESWADNGGCDPEPEITEIGDDVELRRFTGCDEGVGVELYTIAGGGHTWPGADVDIAAPEATTDTIDTTQLALDWFEAHPRRS